MKHDRHCPVAIRIDTPADTDPQIPLRTFLPHGASACRGRWCRTKEGLTLSGRCRGSVPDIVMHPDLAPLAVVGLSFHLNPKRVHLGSRIDSRFLVKTKQKNRVVRKLSNGIHHSDILGALSCSSSTQPNIVTSSSNRSGFLGSWGYTVRRDIRLVKKTEPAGLPIVSFSF